MNNEVTALESRQSSGDSPSVDDSPMDFDEWVDDNFALTKEGDGFTAFTGDVDAFNSVGPSGYVGFGSEKELSTLENVESNLEKLTAYSQSREEDRVPPLLEGEDSVKTGAKDEDSKVTAQKRKKSSYIPLSRRKKKPKGMPKRPLSAYNLYFQAERTKILATQEEGKPRIGFEGLGKIIGKQWRDLSSSEKKKYGKLAEKDSERYRKEMDAYQEMKAKRLAEEDRKAGEEAPVVSKLVSSRRHSPLDPRFVKKQGTLRTVPIGELTRGGSALLPHPPDSMVSAVSALAPGATSVSYRAIRVEQPPSNPVYGIAQSSSFSDPHYPPVQPDPHYFAQPPGTSASEAPSYSPVVLKKGEASRSPNCPMPPGMEVVLADRNGIDRKYSVQYTCYSMTRENANKYIDSITRGTGYSSSNAPPIPWPQPPPPTTPSNLEFHGESWRV